MEREKWSIFNPSEDSNIKQNKLFAYFFPC